MYARRMSGGVKLILTLSVIVFVFGGIFMLVSNYVPEPNLYQTQPNWRWLPDTVEGEIGIHLDEDVEDVIKDEFYPDYVPINIELRDARIADDHGAHKNRPQHHCTYEPIDRWTYVLRKLTQTEIDTINARRLRKHAALYKR